jgi:hypothetical protein
LAAPRPRPVMPARQTATNRSFKGLVRRRSTLCVEPIVHALDATPSARQCCRIANAWNESRRGCPRPAQSGLSCEIGSCGPTLHPGISGPALKNFWVSDCPYLIYMVFQFTFLRATLEAALDPHDTCNCWRRYCELNTDASVAGGLHCFREPFSARCNPTL